MTKNQTWAVMLLITLCICLGIGGCWDVQRHEQNLRVMNDYNYDNKMRRMLEDVRDYNKELHQLIKLEREYYESTRATKR